jgi:hypothetical protein
MLKQLVRRLKQWFNVTLQKLKVDPIRPGLVLQDMVITTTTMLLEILLVVNTIFLIVSIYTLTVFDFSYTLTRNDQSSRLWSQVNCRREMREQELQLGNPYHRICTSFFASRVMPLTTACICVSQV